MTKTCETCSSSFVPARPSKANRFCSLNCYWKSLIVFEPDQPRARTFVCEGCGVTFAGRRGKGGRPRRFCTRRCGTDYNKAIGTTKGHAKANSGTGSKTYRAWRSMKERCYNPKHRDYPNYGGRGIKVCDRWRHSFTDFLQDMGEAPDGMTLERKRNAGNYESTNCVWATPAAQARNRRSTLLTEERVREIRARAKHGEAHGSIAKRLGVSYSTVANVISGQRWADVV